jgi:tRNA threonylcarbamoyladenosine biosynthesis protein TsaB
MALILSIETSENTCSIALGDKYNLIGTLDIADEKSHSSMLTVLINELFKQKQININELNAVAISKGPGSYTGLRIGVSVAKGISYALNKPIIGINTLQILSKGFIQSNAFRQITNEEENILLCPMLDARRMEVYNAFFSLSNEPVSEISASIIDPNSFIADLEVRKIFFFGSGSQKCKDVITHSNAFFIEGIKPHASNMISLAYDAFLQQKFEDNAYFEPFYLKDFVATVAKRKVLSF